MSKKPSICVGDVFPVKGGGSAEVVDYLNFQKVHVRFDTGNEKVVRTDHLKKGLVRNPMRKTAAGVGYLGEDVDFLPSKEVKRLDCVWRNMLARCYNPSAANYAAYGGKGVTVSDELHCFNTFCWVVSNLPRFDEWRMAGDVAP